MNKIEYIIIHHSDSTFGDVETIRRWHLEKGWRDIGYSGVILNGYRSKTKYNDKNIGLFEIGRGMNLDDIIDSEEKGAHALGYNKKSLGICLIGKDKFYIKQFQTALFICALYSRINPEIKIIGHNECENTSKTCPNFDMAKFRGLFLNRNFTGVEIKDVLGDFIYG